MQFLLVFAFLLICAVNSRQVYNPDSLGLRSYCNDVFRATNYTSFQNVKTGLWLSYEGIASKRWTYKNVFQPLTYIYYDTHEYNTPFVTGVALFGKPWFNTSENQLYAMDINGGCTPSAVIKLYTGNTMSKNRLFLINNDGTIGSTCNQGKNWRLFVNGDGSQVMRNISEVPSDGLQWRMTFYKSTDSLPY